MSDDVLMLKETGNGVPLVPIIFLWIAKVCVFNYYLLCECPRASLT